MTRGAGLFTAFFVLSLPTAADVGVAEDDGGAFDILVGGAVSTSAMTTLSMAEAGAD